MIWNLFGLGPFFEPNKKNLSFQLYIQSLERFQSCCMSCHVATMEVLVCHNMTTYLLIASWLAHHSVWVGAGARQNSVAFLLLKKHASIFMCAMVKRSIFGMVINQLLRMIYILLTTCKDSQYVMDDHKPLIPC